MNRRDIIFGLAAVFGPASAVSPVRPALAAARRRAADTDLQLLGAATVAAASSGDSLQLTDGRLIRLAGFEAANPPPDAEPGRRWPLAAAAQQALADFAAHPAGMELWAESAEPDRHGRLIVHLKRLADGVWAQEALLQAGHGRVRPVPGDTARARALLAAEDAARRAGRGVWASRAYAVRPAEDVGRLLRDGGALTVVEGRPVQAQHRSGKVYLDFGEDWRRDFTAVVVAGAARGLRAEGIDVKELTGRLIRLRGWPERRFGPQMEIVVAAQLEVPD